ncbi:lachrymatory-factor synthase [Prosopis cineraria]|uniref:lachrymatory-factor synthase n=1 Tax=Prosopis cineraria TaxID=364024 RepID=UPI00240F0A58|nr:lachrymatory-factor synthase [Prosopis cineraria]
MAEEPNSKWEGKACVEIPNTDTEQAWHLLEDFCNLHKLMPIDTCYQADGSPGQPGLVRYCASTVQGQGEAEPTVKWAKEKLLALDPIQRCLTYQIIDNNIGFKSYVSTIKVLPMEADGGLQGCKIEWSFVSDPVEGWAFQDLISYIDSSLHHMANKMQQACPANS